MMQQCTSFVRSRAGVATASERVVEPRLLVLESLLSLVKLVEARLLPLAVILVLRGSSLAEASGEVGSPSVELSSELVEWIASGC
jgi:hypothetical protein